MIKMAKENWKKVQSGVVDSWQKGNYYSDYYSIVQVYKEQSMNPPWRASLHINGKFVEDGQFKDKSEAMKLARKYMRTH